MSADTATEQTEPTTHSSTFRPLRVWPVVLLLAVMGVAKVLAQVIENGPPQIWMVSAFGPLLVSLVIMLFWWLGMSRASWSERLLGFVGVLVAFGITVAFAHSSMRGPALMMLTIPMGVAAFAIGTVFFRSGATQRRTYVALGLASAGFLFSTLLRNDGMWGNFDLALDWRWNPSVEEQLVAGAVSRESASVESLSGVEAALANPEWPEFRGAGRTGRQSGLRLETDWNAHPPQEQWRIPVGPAWSSFAVAGDMLFTQEQRGEEEFVVCYEAVGGKEIWSTSVQGRLQDPLGGPGPRATPTIAHSRLFTFGSIGDLQCLDPTSGDIIWQKKLTEEPGVSVPMWGFCSSPLVVGSTVVVNSGGPVGTLGFDVDTGEKKWAAPSGKNSYSSPQLVRLGQKDYVLMLSASGMHVIDPESGNESLSYAWKHQGYRALQPHLVDGDSILLPSGLGSGTRRIQLLQSGETIATKDTWTSRSLKPDFNDFVTYEGHAYGFDQTIFTCIDLATGEKKWKGGRYGKGQTILLEDSGIVFVITEKGQGVLLEATPSGHKELAKLKMLNDKTWNHPVVVGNRLFVRNAKEAACYELASVETNEPTEKVSSID